MSDPKPTSVQEVIRVIRINLENQAAFLRQLDAEQSEQVAQKLDRLRVALRQYAKS